MAGSVYNINEISELFHSGGESPVRVICVGVFETGKRRAAEGGSAGPAGTAPGEAPYGTTLEDFLYSMKELEELVKACGMEPAGSVTQNLEHAANNYYVGSGKLLEIREIAEETGSEGVIFNDSLSPAQFRNLQKELGLPVLDRTALILEIFRTRAKTRESMLQVEFARLSYIRTRLVGMWDTLGRKGGASGAMSSRGEGETQLELDRRQIDTRLAELRRELKEVSGERSLRRRRRGRSQLPVVSLIGYTNAGKSTIMNAMLDRFGPQTGKGAESRTENDTGRKGKHTAEEAGYPENGKKVFEADMLFATLDSSVRRISTGRAGDFLLSDTVGFIHKLPTTLVEAFKSTLEEAAEADLLILVADRSDSHFRSHLEVTEGILKELGAGGIPRIIVYNKADRCMPPIAYPRLGAVHRDAGRDGGAGKSLYISAKDPASIDMLADEICEVLYGSQQEAEFLIPYAKSGLVHELMQQAEVLSTEYTDTGTRLRVCASEALIRQYNEHLAD